MLYNNLQKKVIVQQLSLTISWLCTTDCFAWHADVICNRSKETGEKICN